MATDDAEEISAPSAVPTVEDRLAAPKAAAPSFVSTFINKDTSGKKVAPKAVRRRGGAGAAARAADTSTTQTTETSIEPTSTASTAPAPPIEPSVTLPTPAATQEASSQDVSHTTQTAGIAILPPLPTPSQTIATPPPTAPIAAVSQREESPKRRRAEEVVDRAEPLPAAAPAALPHPTSAGIAHVDEGVEPTRSPKRRRVERLTDTQTHAVSRASPDRSHPPSFPNRDVGPTQPLAMQTTEVPIEGHLSRNLETGSTVPHVSALTREPTAVSSPQPQLRTEDDGREHTTEDLEVGTGATESNSEPAGTTQGIGQQVTAAELPAVREQIADKPISPDRERRAPTRPVKQGKDAERPLGGPRIAIQPKGRGRRKVASTVQQENESADQEAGDSAEQAAVGEAVEDWTPVQPPKKTRKPRKDKGQKRKGTAAPAEEVEVDLEAAAAPTEVVSDQVQPFQRRRTTRKRNTTVATADADQTAVDEETEPAAESRPARRPRAPRKRRTTTSSNGGADAADGQNGDQAQPARRRGRQRESTPPDAEDIRIDEETTVMATVAAAHFRTGKISRREKAMREINWEEVKERRRREEALGVPRLSKRTEVDEELNRAAEAYTETHQHMTGPRYEVVDGEIVVVESSAPVPLDMNGEEIDAREVVEEGDLTARITTKSFLREGKRFPEQFMLPGQGTRWNRELTERFYDALQTFGTDFGMISTLFPGSTRRSIKLKFNREEKENPAGIKAALNGQRNSSWDDYLKKSGMTDDYFLDPKAIEEELQAERERMQVEIDAARAAAEEERRQRRIAGAELSEDEDGQADGGKKKRKKREKKVVFQDEGNVEILGEIGDEEDEL